MYLTTLCKSEIEILSLIEHIRVMVVVCILVALPMISVNMM